MPGIAADVVGMTPTGNDVRTLLDIAPRDIEASLVSADRHAANLVFPVGAISLTERNRLIESIRADLSGDLTPPAGVTATPSGLAVIGIELVHGMEANRSRLTLAALVIVALWLVARGKLRPRAILPLVPIAIAVGISTFIVWAVGIELTPLTTVAAPLVIAVATEFTILLEARYSEERRSGRSPDEAVSVGLPRIGRAFVASGLTLIGGFAVMALSPMPLLRDFGIVVAIDVVIALACALVIMPALLRWTDRPEPTSDARTGDRSRRRTPPCGRGHLGGVRAHSPLRMRVHSIRGDRQSATLAGQDAIGVVDAVDLADRADHRIEMLRVGELELEPHARDAVVSGRGRAGDDVHVLI